MDDKIDYFDRKEYVYFAFIMDDLTNGPRMQMMRVLHVPGSSGNPVMDWSFYFSQYTSTQATDKDRRMDPVFIHDDTADSTAFYLSGYYRGNASIMRFQKRNAKLRWWLSFPKMTRINSVKNLPGTDTFLACGHYWVNEDLVSTNTDTSTYQTSAVIMKIKNDGSVVFYMSISGNNPVSTKTSQDECWGVTTNALDDGFSAVFSVKMTELRDSTKGDFRDVLLVLFTSAGLVKRATMFTTGNIQKDLFLTGNALINYQDQYLFSGQSIGYQTSLQKLIYTKDPKTGGLTTTTKTDLDAFIYRYIFDRTTAQCVFSTDLKVNDVTRRITTYNGVSVQAEGYATLTTDDTVVSMTRYAT